MFMESKQVPHNFHIPVMGIGYSIDTALRVSQFGINSVISLVDDGLMEKIRQFYYSKFNLAFKPISEQTDDYRAKRITEYLNMIADAADKAFNELKSIKNDISDELKKYFELLPDTSALKEKFIAHYRELSGEKLSNWLNKNLLQGTIDVNIMTKLDKVNKKNNVPLPVIYNDAHAALRGFALSKLENSSLVLSAGLNPRLFSYIEGFDDFYPDASGNLNKKVTLKVSDYRSAIIQGKFFAKKGIWISEFRIESGLNCGGHAFPVHGGSLMGPVLEEFKNNREELIAELNTLYVNSLKSKGKVIPENPLPVKITAQGGVGTANEHRFLLNYYKLDSVGWGTPFLLVPEVTNVDDYTLDLLQKATEDDVYLSDISPYGIPFNNLRNNTKDLQKEKRINDGNPGSNCYKKYGCSNYEFPGEPTCTGSTDYQRQKINELLTKNLDNETYQKEYRKIVDKACICVGLGTSALIKKGISTNSEGNGVSICPGPNIAYFSKVVSLKEMVDHIYGKINLIERTDRPHMFINELKINIDYYEERIIGSENGMSGSFRTYLLDAIKYYKNLFSNTVVDTPEITATSLSQLSEFTERLARFQLAE